MSRELERQLRHEIEYALKAHVNEFINDCARSLTDSLMTTHNRYGRCCVCLRQTDMENMHIVWGDTVWHVCDETCMAEWSPRKPSALS